IAKPRKGLWQSVSFAFPISCKSADLPGYCLCFLLFQELRFLPLWEESSKEAHEGGEREISPPCDPPLCAPKAFSFEHPPPRVGADLPALLMKCFQLETQILSPTQKKAPCFRRTLFL
ncbi:MAG: hypothetical protein II727_02965, partial [Oscillospiraceae bacterium]|nr:hypothetical protein [Oscillospiraceae bacterium]